MESLSNTISLRECIDWMDAGLTFSFKCCTYDKKRRRKSGKWLEAGEAIALKATENDDGETLEKPQTVPKTSEKSLKKNPNNRYHFTRNIRICVGKKPIGSPIKIHLDLLTRFNGKKVLLP